MTEKEIFATTTAAEMLAQDLGAEMEALLERIGGLQIPHPKTARRVRGARMVSREFLHSMIVAAGQTPEVRELGTFDPDETLAVLQFNDAFRIFADRMEMLLGSIRYTMEARKANVAEAALHTYALLKVLARKKEYAHLGQIVESLSRDLGRKSGKAGRKAKE